MSERLGKRHKTVGMWAHQMVRRWRTLRSALVLTRDPSGQRPPKAIFSTDPSLTAEQIVRDAHEALESGSDF